MALARGAVTFEAGDEMHSLVFDFNALCQLEDEFGVTINEIGDRMNSAKAIRSVFRIGLSRENADVTDEDAGRIITRIGATRASELIGKAFEASNPAPKGDAKGKADPQKKAASTI